MSADADGSVMHWNYGKPGRVVIQEPNVESGRITRVRFDDAGCRFGTSDASGGVRLWNFDADHCLHNPYFVRFIDKRAVMSANRIYRTSAHTVKHLTIYLG